MKLIKYIFAQIIIFALLSINAYGQQSAGGMMDKEENLSSFRAERESGQNLVVWKKLNLPSFYQHPDFGKLPFNAPCDDCVEILDRRTGDYRYFIDVNDHQKFYIQKSLGEINYLVNNDWISKDVALKPLENEVYESRKSAQKVGIDILNKRTYIVTSAGKINFNQWQLIGLNDGTETLISEANWSNYTIGEDGAKIINIFPNIDAEMIVRNGSVKTNFIINQNEFGQFDQLVFRDAMSSSLPVSFNFKNTNDIIAAGEMEVNVGGQTLLEISEGIAYLKEGPKEDVIILNYAHTGNSFDVIVPMDWVNLNIVNGPLVVDPLVTGTATLAQSAITGSMYNSSCNFDNSCDYPLVVPTPAQAVFTDVRFSFDYLPQGSCRQSDGAYRIQVGSCLSPSTAGFFWFCNSNSTGLCEGLNISIFSDVSSCFPAPACTSQDVLMTFKFYRGCKGASGCSSTCIGPNSPFVAVIEGKTLEFINNTTPITISNTTVCQGATLNASSGGTAGVAPITYNWSFSPTGTPSFGSTSAILVPTSTPGNQTVYVTVTDACGNAVTSNVGINVIAAPVATPTNNSPICSGGNLNLTGNAVPGATYAWTGPNGFTSSAQSPSISPVTTAAAGTYTLIITNGACSSIQATTEVVISPPPTPVVTSNSPVCLGGTLNLFTDLVAGATYAWTGPNGFTSTDQNPIISPVTATAAGTYSLTITNNGCTSAPASTNIVISPATISAASSNSPICIGGVLNLTANSISGATYAWTGPNGFTSTDQNPVIDPVTAASSGTYTLTVDNGGCISAPATVDVVVNAVPSAVATSNSPVCVGGTLNLTANSISGATYAWTGPNGFISSDQNPVVTPVTIDAVGTYTLTISNGGCTSVAATTDVLVNPTSVATPSSNSPICNGGTLNLVGNMVPGATYAWTGPNGFTSSDQAPVINPVTSLSAGTYTLTIDNGGCISAPGTVDVIINDIPAATASSNSPICIDGTINLTANTISGATYAWTGPNGFTSTDQNPIINPITNANAGTYTLTITSAGCLSVPSTVDVVINPTPTATPNYNVGLCEGGSLNLTANTISGATYAWTGPNGFTSTDQNPTINPATTTAAGTYTLVISNAGCVSTAATVDVIISPAPTATATYNVDVCEGGTLNLSSNTVVGATYAWTGPNGFTSAVQNPDINTVTLAASGTYNLTITVSGCTPASTTVNVVISPAPTATATSNSPICSGSTLNLNANTVANATYAWTGPNGFTSANQNPTIPAVTSTASGSYTLTVTTPGCAPVTSTVIVSVTTTPTATAGSNAPVCIGATLNLTANTVVGATYSWTGPNSFSSTDQNPTIPNTTSLNAGTYSLTISQGTCQSIVSTTSVSFNPLPVVNLTKTDILCFGGATGTATATPTVPGTYTYAWSPSGGTAQTANNLSAGVYTVSTTSSDGCVSSNSITINQSTDININMSSTLSGCGQNTGTATVVATGGTGSYTYAWSPSGGSASTASNLAVGNYSVSVTDGNGCVKVGNVTVASATPPVISISNATNVTCFGLADGSATIAVSGGTPAYTYNWLPTGGNTATASNLSSGQYTVTVIDDANCTTSQIIDITAPAELVINTTGNGANCGFTDGVATVDVSGGTAPYSYMWTPGNLTTQTINNLPNGTYDVVVIDANGCNAATTYDVVQIGGLNIQVNPVSVVIFEGESVNLNATLSPYVPGLVYTWTPSSGLSCTDCPNPTATPDSTTIYTVSITTPDGCTSSVTSTVITKVNCGEYFIPTIFSPNGDGNNDLFKVFGKCIVGLDLKVFNRWGELVFESAEQEYGWDGTYKGELVSTDSYYYVVKLSFQDGTFASEKGSVNVVR